jgi:hypothetical protein
MTYDPEWYLKEDTDEAKEHRRFLAQFKETAHRSSLPRKSTPADDFELLGRFMAEALAPLQERIKALEDRPAGVEYKGVYRKGCSYSRNQATSHQGSLWIAVKDYPEKEPGEPSSGWRLAVKKGRDGKDGKNG